MRNRAVLRGGFWDQSRMIIIDCDYKKSWVSRKHLKNFLVQTFAIALIFPYFSTHSNDWINFKFNWITELRDLAGMLIDFSVTYKSDGKPICKECIVIIPVQATMLHVGKY